MMGAARLAEKGRTSHRSATLELQCHQREELPYLHLCLALRGAPLDRGERRRARGFVSSAQAEVRATLTQRRKLELASKVLKGSSHRVAAQLDVEDERFPAV